MCDLDLQSFSILSHNSLPAGQNISKFLLNVAWAMPILQMPKYLLAVCANSIYGYIMFSGFSGLDVNCYGVAALRAARNNILVARITVLVARNFNSIVPNFLMFFFELAQGCLMNY